jgi:hypothetical protein
LNRVIRTRLPEGKGRGSLYAGSDGIFVILPDLGRILALLQAVIEGVGVQVETASIGLEVLDLEGLLVLEEHIVHLPI